MGQLSQGAATRRAGLRAIKAPHPRGERVALALAVSEMQNVPPLGLEQPAVSFHKRSELRVLPSNGHP